MTCVWKCKRNLAVAKNVNIPPHPPHPPPMTRRTQKKNRDSTRPLNSADTKNYGWCDIEFVHTHGACSWFAPLLPVRDYQDLPRMFHLKNISWIRIHMWPPHPAPSAIAPWSHSWRTEPIRATAFHHTCHLHRSHLRHRKWRLNPSSLPQAQRCFMLKQFHLFSLKMFKVRPHCVFESGQCCVTLSSQLSPSFSSRITRSLRKTEALPFQGRAVSCYLSVPRIHTGPWMSNGSHSQSWFVPCRIDTKNLSFLLLISSSWRARWIAAARFKTINILPSGPREPGAEGLEKGWTNHISQTDTPKPTKAEFATINIQE